MADQFPKIRDDLVIQEVTGDDGARHYIIKDPITNAFFKVGEPEYFIIRNFDGHQTSSDILSIFKEKFGADLAENELIAFADHLQKLCFLDNELTKKELLKKQKEADTLRPKTLLGRLIFFRLKAFDPGRLFEKLIKHVGVFFTRGFVWLAVLSIFLALIITLYNTEEITDGVVGLLNLEGIIIAYLSMFVVIIFHEFAHGLTCTHYGGKVNEIGFLMIYFQPAFYCNVSDAWLFPQKSRRLWVSFSGGFVQLFIWSLAVILWRVTQTDLIINKIALAVMAVSGIQTLFNFNPLLRYDGYYLLSDYFEIPNLRHKARRYWLSLIRKILRTFTEEDETLSRRERKIYFYYGFLSFLYIVFILGYFFYKVAGILVGEWGGVGFVIFAAIMLFLFRNIIVTTAKETISFLRRRRPLIITSALVLILILICIFGHWQLRVKGEVKIDSLESLILKYDNLGYAQLIINKPDFDNPGKQREVSVFGGEYTTTSLIPMVRVGEAVNRGQIIARLANSEVARFVNEYTAQSKEAEEELAILVQGARPEEISRAQNTVREYEAQLEQAILNLGRMNEMYEKKVISRQEWETAFTDSSVKASRLRAARDELGLLLAGSRPEEIRAKKAEIEKINSRIEAYRQQQEFSEIESAIAGTVLSVDTGEVACEIAPLDVLMAIITVSEKELADIEIGQAVKFKARSYPSRFFYGKIFRIEEKVIVDKNEKPSVRIFCRVDNEGRLLKPGMTGVAVIYCGKRPISYLIYRKFFRTIRTEFWDWFDWS